MTSSRTEPEINKAAFSCPFCDVYANFHWSTIHVSVRGGTTSINNKAARCAHCNEWSIWTFNQRSSVDGMTAISGELIYPQKYTSPLPNDDLPESCKKEYQEAREVLPLSPRSAAALLRLCIQNLCKELGEKGRDINNDIGNLVKNGLDERIQKALDIVRVTGNNSVHPGVMNIDDDRELVNKLFSLVNMIVDEMLTKPKDLQNLYGKLPDGAVEAIEKRDE